MIKVRIEMKFLLIGLEESLKGWLKDVGISKWVWIKC